MIKEKSFEFALIIIDFYKLLQSNKEFIISKQLLRSGISIGANIEEANAGQSKKDFLHKMSIASKEARETQYWLKLLQKSNLIQIKDKNDLNVYNLKLGTSLSEIDQIINILTKIVKTTSNGLNDEK